MEKEFVPYEIALSLKELGFNEPCFGNYNNLTGQTRFIFGKTNEGCITVNKVPGTDKIISNNERILAPTFSQAFRFFREKYKLSCSVELTDNSRHYYFDFTIYDSKNRDYNDEDCFDSCKRIYDDRKFDTYEEAELECLKQLIRNVKN